MECIVASEMNINGVWRIVCDVNHLLILAQALEFCTFLICHHDMNLTRVIHFSTYKYRSIFKKCVCVYFILGEVNFSYHLFNCIFTIWLAEFIHGFLLLCKKSFRSSLCIATKDKWHCHWCILSTDFVSFLQSLVFSFAFALSLSDFNFNWLKLCAILV